MSIYIEDEETCRLAYELAQLTGETVTDAITVALRERLERQREIAERLRRMREISKRAAKLLRPGPSAVEHGDWLYDEDGLPRQSTNFSNPSSTLQSNEVRPGEWPRLI